MASAICIMMVRDVPLGSSFVASRTVLWMVLRWLDDFPLELVETSDDDEMVSDTDSFLSMEFMSIIKR